MVPMNRLALATAILLCCRQYSSTFAASSSSLETLNSTKTAKSDGHETKSLKSKNSWYEAKSSKVQKSLKSSKKQKSPKTSEMETSPKSTKVFKGQGAPLLNELRQKAAKTKSAKSSTKHQSPSLKDSSKSQKSSKTKTFEKASKIPKTLKSTKTSKERKTTVAPKSTKSWSYDSNDLTVSTSNSTEVFKGQGAPLLNELRQKAAKTKSAKSSTKHKSPSLKSSKSQKSSKTKTFEKASKIPKTLKSTKTFKKRKTTVVPTSMKNWPYSSDEPTVSMPNSTDVIPSPNPTTSNPVSTASSVPRSALDPIPTQPPSPVPENKEPNISFAPSSIPDPVSTQPSMHIPGANDSIQEDVREPDSDNGVLGSIIPTRNPIVDATDMQSYDIPFDYKIEVTTKAIDNDEDAIEILDNFEAAVVNHSRQTSNSNRNLGNLGITTLEISNSRTITGKLKI